MVLTAILPLCTEVVAKGIHPPWHFRPILMMVDIFDHDLHTER